MRTHRARAAWQFMAGLTLAAMLAGCGGSASAPTQQPAPATAPAPAGPKNVSIAMWSPPSNFDSVDSDSNYSFYPISLMFDTLLVRNEKGEFKPKLAEKWDISPDYTTFTFHLNPKAKWHDGEPVTAKDVAFTYNIISHPKTATTRAAYLVQLKGTDLNGKSPDGSIEGMKVIDDHTIQFTTKQPMDPESLTEKLGTGIYILPEHVLGKVTPQELLKNPFFMNPTVGSGPFKFAKYATDQYIELKRNDDYYLGKPKLDEVFIRIMQPASAVAALQKGEIDLTAGDGIGEIPIADWDKVQQLANMNAVSYVSKGYQYMDFNATRPFFKDPRVRQAFISAINRQLIVDQLLKGQGVLMDGPYTPINKYRDDSLKRPYDPEKAKQLLKDAGWDFNQQVTLQVPTGNLVREQSSNIIMANLQAVGVKVQIQKMDFPTMQSLRKKNNFDISLVGWSAALDPDVSSQFKTGQAYNFGGYSNPTADKLLDQGIVTADPKDRMAVYKQLQQVLFDDPPFAFLYSPKALTAVSKRMVNVHMSAFGNTSNAWEWDIAGQP